MEAHRLVPGDVASASAKLGRDDARELAENASKLIVAKGKNVRRFDVGRKATDEAVDAMLGPTGNLRAPTLRVGKTLLVGFDEDSYAEVLT